MPNNGVAHAADGYLYGGNGTTLYRLNPPPVPLTSPATSVLTTSATLNGTINGETQTGTVYFDYGVTTGYGSSTASQAFAPGSAAVNVSANLVGLQPLVTYHYRLVAVSPLGTFFSADQTFATSSGITFNAATDVPANVENFNATGVNLTVGLGFAPSQGTVLTLVNQYGFSPVFGTFNNLPEGALVSATFGGQPYLLQISYTGGDGNDITLKVVTQGITFPAIPVKKTTDASFALNATASSGLAVSYSIVAGGASATLSGNTVNLTGVPGTVTIKATQAGNGTTFTAATPVYRTFTVTNGSAFVQVASSKGSDFSLGIRADGSLWAWGINTNSQLGDGTTTTRRTPVQVGAASPAWTRIACGASHSLAVRSDGTLWAWGLNTNSQLGDNTAITKFVPTQIGTLNTWANVSAGGTFSVAVKTDGTLWAWGGNTASGEIGQGSTLTTNYLVPTQIGALTTWSTSAAALSCGTSFTLALQTDGSLWAWGLNSSGQLGTGTTTTATSPVQAGTATNWAAVSANGASSIGRRTDGTLWTWGSNNSGQLGDGTLAARMNPSQVGTDANWNLIQGGNLHNLATKTDGTLWAWGGNASGQLGLNFADAVVRGNLPTQVGTDTDWQAIGAGNLLSLGIKTNGSVWSWGSNANGQIGNLPRTPLPMSASLGPITTASLGSSSNSAVLRPDGTLWVWGANASGQLGIGSADSAPHPVATPLGAGFTWTSVSAGASYYLAIRADGSLWGAGLNTSGQLGDGSTINRTVLTRIGTANDWRYVASGPSCSFGIKTNGTLWAWGLNSSGQLGDGTTTTRSSPVQIGTDTDWNIVSSGFTSAHTLALKTNGTLWAWGLNTSNQLGDGTATQRLSPVQIGADTDWSTIALGSSYSLALKTSGTLWGWGLNTSGQIGDGTVAQRASPVQVGTATNWNSIGSTNGATSMATRSDGTLWAWGPSSFGQFGDGTYATSVRTVPGQVGASTDWLAVVSVSGSSQAVLAKDHTLWVWGLNNLGVTAHVGHNLLLPDLVFPALTSPQSFTFATLPAHVAVGSTLTLSATSTSGMPARYLVTGPATVVDDQLTINGTGPISVLAYQPGDLYWQSGSSMRLQVINIPLPAATTFAATSVGTTTATLHAVINPNGVDSTAKFQSGLMVAYGTDTPITLSPTNGVADQVATLTLTGLTPGSTYHFRASATNAGGTVNGADFTFTTVSNNPNLSALALSDGTLTPAFDSNITSYTMTLPHTVASLTLTPTAAGPNAAITVNGAAVASGSASAAQTLVDGVNTITVGVVAEDGVTGKTYTIVATRNTGYQDVAITLGLIGPTADPLADADGDGINNLMEVAFGTSPTAGGGRTGLKHNGNTITPGQPIVENNGGWCALYVRRKDAATVGLTYTVRFSNDLITWQTSTVTPTIIADDGTYQVACVPYPTPTGTNDMRFFNVVVALSP